MPRLSEPGPLGMRADHWYDFGSLAGNGNFFVQVVAHIAAAAVPNTPLGEPTGGHRPLLMMSFLRRLALVSHGSHEGISCQVCGTFAVWCWTTRWSKHKKIKTIQCLEEADPHRVLVALDLKAVFQNVSRRAMAVQHLAKRPGPCSCLFQIVHWNHRAHDALRLGLQQNQRQPWCS